MRRSREEEPQKEIMLSLCCLEYGKEGLNNSPAITIIKEVGSPGSVVLPGNWKIKESSATP